MESFNIALAGKIIKITPLFSYIKKFCKDYLTEGEEEFCVSVTMADIDFEREKSAREDDIEGIPTRHFSDAYMEILAVYRKIAQHFLEDNILLFHGSAIAVDGQAYLFTAKSGTGKSTHSRLWREWLGERAFMVNDDKPLLKITADGVFVCGTPWDGKHHLSTNTSVPLKALCILERAETNHIEPISFKEAYPMLLQQSYRPAEPEKLLKTLVLAEQLGKTVKLYRLGCNMDPEAARVSYEGMQA